MAVLDATNRLRVGNQFMRLGRAVLGTCAFTKTDVRAAVDATDTWIDGQQANFNAALPVGFRNNATLLQKTLLFCYVAMRRAGLLRADED